MREIVKQEVNRSVVAYETRIGGPRHEANQAWLNQIDGGIRVLKMLGGFGLGIITACASVTGIYIALHYHH